MPGLPKGAFSENPVKRLDFIRGIYVARLAGGARCAVFRIWVRFPSGRVQKGNPGGPEKKARQNAIRGSGGHYMCPDLWPFWRSGRAKWPDCRRWNGSPTWGRSSGPKQEKDRGFSTVAGAGSWPASERITGASRKDFRIKKVPVF